MNDAVALTTAFETRFGSPPELVARAPGRVNLIGEHVDYFDLPVLPMALTRSIRVAFRPRTDRLIHVANLDPAYEERHFALGPEPTRDRSGDWGNYLKAAAVVAERFGAHVGMEAMVASDLPPAAGLSSSSALVVATALALLRASGERPEPLALAEALARGEQFVGTRGGGMDQAVSLGGQAGHALRIEFSPLRWTPVPLPGDWRVVVAHSGVRAEKSGPAQHAYNERRRAGEAALAAVSAVLGRRGASYPELLVVAPEEVLLETGERVLEPRLAACFRHVITETQRVVAAEELLLAGDLTGFGGLLTLSHVSLRDDYRVSHPRLDALVDAALDAGAEGARLTGAGFGGCTLAVCESAVAEVVEETLRAELIDDGVPPDEALVFQADAGPGATVSRADGA